jgi:hypothetical protein
MRKAIAVVALVATAWSTGAVSADGATPSRPFWKPGAWWMSVGINSPSVEHAERDCPGGQVALAFGRRAFLKLQRTSVTYETNDGSGSCDGGVVGDSSITENALLAGVSFRRTGLFTAIGPARVSVDDYQLAGRVEDSGIRFELGWSSRRLRGSRSWSGLEITAFAVNNDALSYRGIALNLTVGQAGR